MTDRPSGPGASAPQDDADLRGLRALAGARVLRADVQWEEPPDGLWERIEAQVRHEDRSETGGPTAEAERSGLARGRSVPRRGGASGRRSAGRLAPWLLGAAAVVLLVAAVGVLVRERSERDVVATAALEQLGDAGRGTAELIDADGTMQLRLDVEGLDPGDRFVEVWVIDEGVSKLVSLGPLRDDGVYDLPEGLDARAFPVVDVSYEPFDGNPAHSGDSVLRGTLTF